MSEVLDRTKIYIGGQWVDSDGDGSIEVVDPTTEQVIAKVAEGVVSDVDRAVAAAREAFPAWSALSGAERAAYLEKVSSLANSRVEELTAIVSQDMGMPLSLAKPVQIGMPLKNIAAYAALAGTYDFDDQEIGNASSCASRSVSSGRSPRGITRCIRWSSRCSLRWRRDAPWFSNPPKLHR